MPRSWSWPPATRSLECPDVLGLRLAYNRRARLPHTRGVESRVFLANVGANTSHRYSSPLFDDGSFELLPIPETPPEPGPNSVTFAELRSWGDPSVSLKRFLPARLWGVAAHADPDFRQLTYGDNCERAPRAHALRQIQPGDLLMFIARLRRATGPAEAQEAGFFLIGYLEVDQVVANVAGRPAGRLPGRFEANAHVRKGRNDDRHWDGFWVFGGSKRSRRFRRAVPIDRRIAELVLRDATDKPLTWGAGRSDLQVIGSYTRTCRCIIDPALSGDARHRLAILWQRIHEFNSGVT